MRRGDGAPQAVSVQLWLLAAAAASEPPEDKTGRIDAAGELSFGHFHSGVVSGCYTRLDLAHVELVPYLCADLWSWDYGDDDALVTASEDARRSLLTKYLDRRLQADHILTISNYDFGVMQECSDLTPILMTEDEET
ncbi:hypothetical protein THAOC_23810, partial [Thalassiosira oceanica]